MWSKYKYYFIAGIVIGLLIFIEALKPKPIIWKESYSRYDKIPYGCYVLYEELDHLFHDSISPVDKRIRQLVGSNDNDDKNYIFINDRFEIDENEVSDLLSLVSDGNQVFISARNIDTDLLDTLSITVDSYFPAAINDSISMTMSYGGDYTYFPKIDNPLLIPNFKYGKESSITTLGYVADTLVNFIRLPYGKGYFYMHLSPLIFTNYNLLNPSISGLVSLTLSILPNRSTFWDEYYKRRKQHIPKSPLKYVLKTDGLRQALYLLISSLFIYMLFAAKRKQRVIPVLEEEKNNSLEFITTVGNLYFQNKDNKDIGMKRVAYLLYDISKTFKIDTSDIHPDSDFVSRLSVASGKSRMVVNELVNNINIIRSVKEISDERLMELDRSIDNFYKILN